MRNLERVVTTPPPAPGFAGPGHTAVEVVTPDELQASDPFVLLMDDRVDFGPGAQVGGAHPHAGMETVTLLLEGEVRDRDEGLLRTGDALWMTAGRGIIHNEHVEVVGKARILQLWVTLPVAERSAPPRFELIRLDSLPIRREPGVEVRLYSGASGELRSPTKNHVPVTLADFTLAPNASVEQQLPPSYNGFVYVIEGALDSVGKGQVGWLGKGEGSLRLHAGEKGARVILYAGERQKAPVVQHGPFVAGSEGEIARLFHEYRAGKFTRMSQLSAQKG